MMYKKTWEFFIVIRQLVILVKYIITFFPGFYDLNLLFPFPSKFLG